MPCEERQRRRIEALMPPPPPPKEEVKPEPVADPKKPTEAEVAVQMCKKVDSSQDDDWVYIVIILQESIERTAQDTNTSLEKLFGVRIYEDYLDVFVKGSGQQFNMIEGYFGGHCAPQKSSWGCTKLWKRDKKGKGKGRGKGERKSVMAISVEICKAVSRQTWDPVFDRQEVDTNPKIDGVPIID